MKHLILFLLLVHYSCSSPVDNSSVIRSFYETMKPNGRYSDFKQIIIINENGNCINCNNKFSREMSALLSDSTKLFIVSGTGAKVDFSYYLDINQDNLIVDSAFIFKKYDIAKSCMIIDLGEEGQFVNSFNVNAKNYAKVWDFVDRK